MGGEYGTHFTYVKFPQAKAAKIPAAITFRIATVATQLPSEGKSFAKPEGAIMSHPDNSPP